MTCTYSVYHCTKHIFYSLWIAQYLSRSTSFFPLTLQVIQSEDLHSTPFIRVMAQKLYAHYREVLSLPSVHSTSSTAKSVISTARCITNESFIQEVEEKEAEKRKTEEERVRMKRERERGNLIRLKKGRKEN